MKFLNDAASSIEESFLKASIKRSLERGKLTQAQYDHALKFIESGDLSVKKILERLQEKCPPN